MRITVALFAVSLAVPLTVGVLTPASAENAPVTIAVVGDVACDPAEPAFNNGLGAPAGCQQKAVGAAIRGIKPQAFLALGDLQYLDGTYDKFMAAYDPAMGDLKPITYPIPGNHEYKTVSGAGYYKYFGAAAHQESRGTYSFSVGAWHVIAINSTACTPKVPCGPGSAMANWIAADVAANPSKCLMAMWHHPIWSAGRHGQYAPMLPVWNQLNGYGADVVLTGHDHLYQRSKPIGTGTLKADGTVADPVVDPNGMVEFIVGTGGENNYEAQLGANPAVTAAMDSVASNINPGLFGPLKMELGDTSYKWEFVPAAGSKPFSDAGTRGCRTKTPPLGAPVMPTDVSVTRAGDGMVDVAWRGTSPQTTYTTRVVGTARSCSTTANSCRLTGLTNGKSYQVTVTASNPVGSLTTPASAPFVPAVKPSRPGVPTATVNGGQVTVSWPATPYNGGLPVQYVVKSSAGSFGCVTSGLHCTIAMDPGSYTFSVLARNDVGDSAVQTTSSPVAVNLPSAPTIAKVERAGDGAVRVTVTPGLYTGLHPIVDHLVKATPSTKSCVAAVPATACTVTGLTNGTSYTFTAVTRTASVSSAASAPSAPLVAARPPVRLAAPTVVSAAPGAATLTWLPSTYEGGLPVTSYEVMVGNGPTVACRATALTCTVTGLVKGTSYWFTVVAINDAGRSANSPGSVVFKAA